MAVLGIAGDSGDKSVGFVRFLVKPGVVFQIRILLFAAIGLFVIAAQHSLAQAPAKAMTQAETEVQLKTHCPPSFELVPGAGCKLRSLYQFYTSNQGRGVGGTRTELPPVRDGFTPQQIDLGRYLFFDPILSADRSLACVSCHQPAQAFTDGKAFSTGHQGAVSTRSAPSLWNGAFLQNYFWDARAKTFEEQMLGPLYSERELANSPTKLLADLNSSAPYKRLFATAFPNQEVITLEQIYQSLAAFQASLISLNSRYDRYAHGDHSALNEEEIAGLNVFRSFVARCAECHTPPLFTNNQIAVIGAPEPAGKAFDVGAMENLGHEKMRGGFKVPSLRNIALTAPYMHSGVFSTLREAAEFYTGGRGHAVPEGMTLHLHWHIWEPGLQAHELDQLVAFLHTLTDQSLLPEVPTRLPSGLSPIRLTKTTNGDSLNQSDSE